LQLNYERVTDYPLSEVDNLHDELYLPLAADIEVKLRLKVNTR